MFKKRRSSSGLGLVADLVDLVGSWWRRDRIRTSPREGRMLRVAAGSILDVEGTRFQVLNRETIETLHGPVVRYDCEGAGSRCELWISISPVPITLLVTDDDERELDADEVEVWGGGDEY